MKKLKPETDTGSSQLPVDDGVDGFIDGKAVLQKVPISAGTLLAWRKRGLIPYVVLPGGRRVVYYWPAVRDALLRAQREGALVAA